MAMRLLATLFLPGRWSPLEVALFGVAALVWFAWGWGAGITLVGGLRRPRRFPAADPRLRFAVVVAAHNEERVIGELLTSLQRQDYPAALFRVFVVADNCTDRTAVMAAEHGAVALIRHNLEQRGKAAAIHWLLGQIPRADFDAVAMFDADNVAAPDFLRRMNEALCGCSAVAVQGYLDTKNPNDTAITLVNAMGYWSANQFVQAARQRIGLSAYLGGTGLVVRFEAMDRLGWCDLQSLTEDLEFTAVAVVAGERVAYCGEAVTWDEKPLTMRANYRQRIRWIQGHYQCAVALVPRLLRQMLRPSRFLAALDMTLYLLSPGRMVLSWMVILSSVAIAYTHPGAERWLSLVWVPWMVVQCLGLTVIAPSVRFGRLVLRYAPYALHYLALNLCWVPICVYGFWTRNNRTWAHTLHTRAIAVAEVAASKVPVAR